MSTSSTIDRTKLPVAGTWDIDAAHSSVEATVRHLVISKVRGRFTSFSGTATIGDDFADSQLDVTIDAASIDTGEADRDGHLRGDDFLDVENHPTLTFRSETVQHDAGDRYKVPGELTIRGVTRPVTLDVEFLGVQTDPWGNERAAFEATTEIDREQFDVTWNQALEAGGVMVGKSVRIDLLIQLVLQS